MISITYQTYIASVHSYGAPILPLYQQKPEEPKKEKRRIEGLTGTSRPTNNLKQSQIEHMVNFLV